MPFQVGAAPIRRTLKYLDAGRLVFKDRVKIMTVNYNEHEYLHLKAQRHPAQAYAFKDKDYYVKAGAHHDGAQEFVFWNLPQIQYKNPRVQVVTLKNMTPSPFITCYLEDGKKVLFDIDSQTNKQILERLIKTLGKSKEALESEALASEKKDNPANFGKNCERWCFCQIPGQIPCPAIVPVPKHWRGKYHFGLAVDEE